MHFHALCQLDRCSPMGMRKRAPVAGCSGEYPKRNLVSGLCGRKTGHTRTDEGNCQFSRRVVSFRALLEYRYKIGLALLCGPRMERYTSSY